MKYVITNIDNRYIKADDNFTCFEFDSFKEYGEALAVFPEHYIRDNKDTLPLFSSAKYKPNTCRLISNVEYQTALIFDFDDKNTDINVLRSIPYSKIIYKSWSWTPGLPKYRMVIEIDKEITSEQWFKECYDVIGNMLLSMGQVYDRACKDFARYFYIPCVKKGFHSADVEYHPGCAFQVDHFKNITMNTQSNAVLSASGNASRMSAGTVSQNQQTVSGGILAGSPKRLTTYVTYQDNNWFKYPERIMAKIEEYKNSTGEHHTKCYGLAQSVRLSYFQKWKQDLAEYELLKFMQDMDFDDPNGFAANHGRTIKDGGTYKRTDCKNTIPNAVRSVYEKTPIIEDNKNKKSNTGE